jgi:GntR family transcriptional regulator, transcriptional repressor for pyruvate dehydrogenase complex
VDTALAAMEQLTLEELKPGDFLPSEADLSQALGVSRLTIREATRALVAKGYLEVRQGRRPLVLQPNGSLLSDYFTSAVRRDPDVLLELLDVRVALEVHAARLAASRPDTENRDAMGAALRMMQNSLDDEQQFHRADLAFHEALVAAGGNRMLLQIIKELAEPMMESRRRSFAGHRRFGNDLQDVVDQHAAILDAVHKDDPDAAAEAMRHHLTETGRDLRTTSRPPS